MCTQISNRHNVLCSEKSAWSRLDFVSVKFTRQRIARSPELGADSGCLHAHPSPRRHVFAPLPTLRAQAMNPNRLLFALDRYHESYQKLAYQYQHLQVSNPPHPYTRIR